MNCNVCGAEIPAGAANCPVCGAPVAMGQAQNFAQNTVNAAQGYAQNAAQGFNQNPYAGDAAPAGGNPYASEASQAYDPYAASGIAGSVPPAPEKKSKTGLIIGIVAAVVVVVGVILCFVFGVFGGKGGTDGKYYLDSMSAMGMSFDADTLALVGYDPNTCYIDVNGSKAKFCMGDDDSEEMDISFSGSTVTLSAGGQSISGTYDSSAKTISIDYAGAGMTFKKK